MKAYLTLAALAALAAVLTACSSQTAIQDQPLSSSARTSVLSQDTEQHPESLHVKEAGPEKEQPGVSPDTKANPVLSDSIWQHLGSHYAFINNVNHPRIQPHLDWLTKNQSYIDRITARGQRYLHYILGEIEARGMPYELALLPAVESAYDPRAYSHSQASGLWQFVPRTGDSFGLKRDWWADQRRDVILSTEAALDYLQYLNKRFDGDWLLALAAYNGGEGTVRRAIRKNRRKGLGEDYWSLPLPRETKGYVPRLVALAKVIQQPQQYGVTVPASENTAYFDVVQLPSSIHLMKASEMAGVEYKTLEYLNPAYKRHVTHPEGPHRLLLPVGHTHRFEQSLASLPESEWKPELQYKVRKGDSLYTLAKKYHLSIKQLKEHNQLSSNTLQIGQRLAIPGTGTATDIPGITYTVKSGDSLWKIAKQQGVSIADIENWNGISAKRTLKPGEQLQIGSSTNNGSSGAQVKKLSYRVRKGDSLSRIASKFVLSIRQILEWNNLDRNDYLKPGQRLTLFVDLNRL